MKLIIVSSIVSFFILAILSVWAPIVIWLLQVWVVVSYVVFWYFFLIAWIMDSLGCL